MAFAWSTAWLDRPDGRHSLATSGESFGLRRPARPGPRPAWVAGGGKAHRDVEAAVWAGARGERGVVGARDGAHDGEPEAVPAGLAGPPGAEPLERLEQPVDLGRRYHRPAVADPQRPPARRPPVSRSRPSRRARCAGARFRPGSRPGFRPAGDRPRPAPGRSLASRSLRRCGPRSRPRRRRARSKGSGCGDAALAAGQREQRVDQLLLLLAELQHLVAGGAQRRRARRPGRRSATCSTVRSAASGVRSSWAALATKCRCDSNDASSRANRSFSVSPSSANSSSRLPRPQPPAQVGGGDVPRGRDDRLQRPQQAAGQQPAEPERQHGHHRQPTRLRAATVRSGSRLRPG